MRCARTGSAAAVKALLARKAQIDARNTEQGQTALMWAVAQKHPEAADALIKAGADIKARSKAGFTPLLFAARVDDVEFGEAASRGGRGRQREGAERHDTAGAGERERPAGRRHFPARQRRRPQRARRAGRHRIALCGDERDHRAEPGSLRELRGAYFPPEPDRTSSKHCWRTRPIPMWRSTSPYRTAAAGAPPLSAQRPICWPRLRPIPRSCACWPRPAPIRRQRPRTD